MHVGTIPEFKPRETHPENWPKLDQSIGYAAIAWMNRFLIQPDGDRAGEPLEPTEEQQHFIAWWYAFDADGKFAFRRAALRRSKGWGKGPFAAMLALFELCGPCLPDRVVKTSLGLAVALGREHPAPLVQLAAVSYSQTENTFASIRGMVSPLLREAYGIDDGATRILMRHQTGRRVRRGKLEPVTTSSSSLEGNRTSFFILDEPHHLVKANGGHKLAAVLRRNAAKVNGRGIETTNAHSPGEESVAEATYEAYLKVAAARAGHAGLLYSALEAPPDTDLGDEESVRRALAICYQGCPWIDIDRLVDEIYDPGTSADEAMRFYFSRVVAASDAWLDPADVDAAVAVDQEPTEDGGIVALGFDGSRGSDATALVAVDVLSGHGWTLGVWQRPDGPQGDGWTVPTEDIDRVVRSAFDRWRVAAFFADYAFFESYIDRWAEDFHESLFVKAGPGHSVAFDMRRRIRDFTYAAESACAAFEDKSLSIADDPHLITHLKNARRRPNAHGVGFGKESRESLRKVDCAAALVLAREARRRAIESGVIERWVSEPGIVYGF
ncbi:terminase [Streptomyces sp. NPDC001941]|uniref:terminase n=1 Tax=Streptomyces sp. NPDC001941 TaxID=3154659 RepID=UPI00332AD537